MDAVFSNPLIHATLFWVCLALLFHTFLGYPLLVKALAGAKPRLHSPAPSGDAPTVAVIIAARNEQERIVSRIENLLASHYPANRLSVILISDGSTDRTAINIQNARMDGVRVIERKKPSGKPTCLNVGVAESDAELIVFADARQRFDADTIPNLVRHFADPSIGAVSGALFIESAASSVGGGVDAYWKLERVLRESEARWDSCIGCTGAVYAIRRRIYEEIPADTLIDDVEIPMRIAAKGYRVLYDVEARAFDSQSLEPARETIRKRRTLAGNYQMLFRHPGWLLPWRNRLWFQLISHKYLRLAAPFLLPILLTANIALAKQPFYGWLLWPHGLFYALAFIGLVLPSRRSPLFSIPSGFVFLNLMSFRGLLHYLFTNPRAGWEAASKPPHSTG
jgi:cellulose synthase/poly-beta-1,6-N-acetylglucosamine synthase-like glycosyltransferase